LSFQPAYDIDEFLWRQDCVDTFGKGTLGLKQAKVESRIVIRVRAAAIGWQVSARALFEFCVAA